MNAYFVEFEPVARGDLQPHTHPGVELLYVLRGRVCVTHDGEDHELHEGDSMYFDASRPHGYRRLGNVPAAAVVVTTPLSRMRR
jgi:quercetin dioxygenase-like cupin family protein